MDAVASGKVDLECGSTTGNIERQKSVAFSPVMFVAGTKLLVKRDFRDQFLQGFDRQDSGRDFGHDQ